MYPLCGSNVANTGEQECDKAKGILNGGRIAIDMGTVEAADYATTSLFFNRLVAKSKLSKLDSQKLFVLPEIQDHVNAKEANKEGSLNGGFKITLQEGKPGYKIKFFGGQDLLKRLKTYDNQTVRIREFDANGVAWGTKKGTDSVGYRAKLFFTGGDAPTGQNVEEGVIECYVSILSAYEYYKNSTWVVIPADVNLTDMTALLDVQLYPISHVTNVWQIGMRINGSNLEGPYNIYDVAGAAIAAMDSDFSAGSGAGYGTDLPITSVAVNAGLKCLTVTFDSTAYTAVTAATNFILNPPTPTELDAADVTETELLSVVLTK